MRANDPLSGTPARRAIAANVRVELARANISGSQMAQRIGVPQATFSRRMVGVVSFSAEEIAAIAAELSVSIENLVRDAVSDRQPAATADAA